MRSRGWGTTLVLALFLAAVPAAAADGLSEGITVETPEGPVTCAPDPAQEPGLEAISEAPFAHGVRIAIRETGGLRCQTQMLGEVEVTGAGLPWRLTLNERRLTARLKGSPKPALRLQPVGLSSLACVYQTGKVLGTLTPGGSPSVSVTVKRVRLNTALSSVLCPELGPVDLSFTLP